MYCYSSHYPLFLFQQQDISLPDDDVYAITAISDIRKGKLGLSVYRFMQIKSPPPKPKCLHIVMNGSE